VGTLTSWNPLGHFLPLTGLLYLYFLQNTVELIKSRRLNGAGNVSPNGDVGNVCAFLVGKPKEEGSVWRSKCTWVLKIKMGVREIFGKSIGWINSI
jgi:hypothetical protein